MLKLISPSLFFGLVLATFGQAAPCPVQVLSGDLLPGPAGGEQQEPAIAGGNGVHLAVWPDHRSAFSSTLNGEGTRDLFGQLIGSDGQPLLANSFRIAGGLGRKEDTQVAWNGTHWLVTWINVVPTEFFYGPAVFAARVDTSGQVLDDPPQVIRSFEGGHVEYALGSDGQNWDLLIQDAGAPNGVVVEGWTVHPNGVPQLVNPSVLTGSFLLFGFQLAWDGTQYLLKWEQSSTRGRRLSSELAPIGSEFTIAGSLAEEASIAARAGGWLATYALPGTQGSEIRYRPISASGVAGAVTQVTASTTYDDSPCATWTGASWTLVWRRGLFAPSELRRARIDSAGTLLDPDGVAFYASHDPTLPVLASLVDGNAQAAWLDRSATPPFTGDVTGARLTPTVVDAPTPLSTSAPRQGFFDLAEGPEGYVAVFTSEREGSVVILAQRIDAEGQSIDAEPIEVASQETAGHPSVAWNGQEFLVVWHDLQEISNVTDDLIFARRLAADGTPIDPTPFLVMEGRDPDVDSVAGNFLVAARFASTTQVFFIHAVRVGAGGALLDAAPLLVGSNHARFPSVAAFGDRWIVTWQRTPSHDSPFASVRARIILPDGSMTTAQSLGAGGGPSVATSQDVALIAYSSGDIMLGRMDPSGDLVGPSFPASFTDEAVAAPAVAWNGAEFVVVWQDQRNISHFFDDRADLYATRVTDSGDVLDTGGLVIAVSPDHDQHPAIAGGSGAAMVLYGGYQAEPWETVRGTVVTLGEPGCLSDSYCQSSPNSVGNGAHISFGGSASVVANDFILIATDAAAQQPGIFFYGTNTASLPFGNGTRCVGGQTFRFSPVLTAAGGDALMEVDLTAPPQPAGQIVSGATWHFQFWYRDPLGGGSSFNLTNGLSVTFCD